MSELHRTRYFVISYDEENALFYYLFNENTEHMLEEEYIAELQTFISLVKEYKPKRVLGHMVDFKFTITPKIQEWINENLFAVYREIDFEKIAILLSIDIFGSVSIQQTMEEETTEAFQTSYFDSEEEAMNWLLEA